MAERLIARLRLVAPALFLLAAACASTADKEASRGANESPPPALNHIYVVLDAPTYAAFRDSQKLATVLGRPDGGLPDYAPPAADADRIFFRGRQTYLEFFAPNNRFGEPVGKVGLALGYDEPAALDRLQRAWAGWCGEQVRRTRVEYRRLQPPVPWYDAVQCDNTAGGPHLAVWAMTYLPEFWQWQAAARDLDRPRTARADILAPRQQDGQGRFDVTGVTLAVPEPMRTTLVAQLERAGFSVDTTAGGVLLRGDGLRLILQATQGAGRIMQMNLAIDGVPGEELPLGSARLAPGAGKESVITFARSTRN